MQIAVHLGAAECGEATLLKLDISSHRRPGGDDDLPGTVTSDAAHDRHTTGAERRARPDGDIARDRRAVQRAGRACGHLDLVDDDPAHDTGAVAGD